MLTLGSCIFCGQVCLIPYENMPISLSILPIYTHIFLCIFLNSDLKKKSLAIIRVSFMLFLLGYICLWIITDVFVMFLLFLFFLRMEFTDFEVWNRYIKKINGTYIHIAFVL